MNLRLVMLMAAVLPCIGLADDSGDRVRLAGRWQGLDEAGKGTVAVWILEEKGDGMHVTSLQGEKKLADFECNTVGRECEIKDAGKHAKVSMWFSGPRLVQLETRGAEVVKRRFSVAGQADAMELEVIPIVPSGQTEKIQLKRMSNSALKQ